MLPFAGFEPFALTFSDTAVMASSLFPGDNIGGAAAALAVCLASRFRADLDKDEVSSFLALDCKQ
jgi:hypothetical protein